MSGADHHPSRLLKLSSRDANVNLSNIPNSYTFSSGDRDLHQIRHVSLKSVEIPNTQYNVNANNNVFRWDDGVARSVTVPEGQYTVTTLLAALNPLVVAITPGFVITEVTLTRKIQFDSPVNPITIQSEATDPLNTLATELGATSDSPVGFVAWTSPSVYALTGLKHIYISSSTLSNQTALISGSDQKTNIFAELPISVPFGAVQTKDIQEELNLDISDFHSFKNISTIDIQLLSDVGVPALLNGAEWTLVLRVWR
jgi:hypothetical protein